MPILGKAKQIIETMTGHGRPARADATALIRRRRAHPYRFRDDGETPNNRRFPPIFYRSPVSLLGAVDPAAVLEEIFAENGWTQAWRDGIYDFLHFHTRTHEVLGIARGHATVQFGGARGRTIELGAGDVIVLPAGTGHRRRSASKDLLVVGAYPAGGSYDEPAPGEIAHDAAVRAIAKVPPPPKDPVYGRHGPLLAVWKATNSA
jgi:uncharacterized protein YjlB